MGKINYEQLVSELIKPLVTHPEDVVVKGQLLSADQVHVEVTVHPDDVGRIIGKKGRVINAVRTIAHAAATRDKTQLEISLTSENEEE